MTDHTSTPAKRPIERFLNTVEWLGNLLPHPITLFALFSLFIIVASAIAAAFGVSVMDPRPAGAAGRARRVRRAAHRMA